MALTTKQILALQSLPGVGIKTILKIGNSANDFIDDISFRHVVLSMSKSSRKIKLSTEDIDCALSNAEDNILTSKRQDISVVSYYENNFPIAFRHAIDCKGKDSPSIILFYKGDFSLLSMDSIAIIGTRKCSQTAAIASKTLARKFASRGFCIVSGLAIGCDCAAHEGALDVPNGKTIAVLANGLDTIYPKTCSDLSERILETGGLLISENVIGTPALNYTLVARDRLQAATSLSTVVIQSGVSGGSMHAALATYYAGKPLYAVRYSNEEINSDQTTQGNHLLASNYDAKYIGGYPSMSEMDNALDLIAEEIRKSKTTQNCFQLS